METNASVSKQARLRGGMAWILSFLLCLFLTVPNGPKIAVKSSNDPIISEAAVSFSESFSKTANSFFTIPKNIFLMLFCLLCRFALFALLQDASRP